MYLIIPISAQLRDLRGFSSSLCLSFVTFVSFCSNSVANEIDFEKQVAPILVQNCLRCHNSSKARAGLNLSSRASALQGSDAGEVLVPGKPRESLLVKRAADGSMPPETDGRRLTTEEVAVLSAWVQGGATWPEGRILSAASQGSVPLSRNRPLVRRVLQHFRARRNLSAAE